MTNEKSSDALVNYDYYYLFIFDKVKYHLSEIKAMQVTAINYNRLKYQINGHNLTIFKRKFNFKCHIYSLTL